MNPQGQVKEAPLPVPLERLNDQGPPPFLNKTYEIVEDSTTNHIVSWSKANNSFVVWDPQAFAISLLPKYFKHGNFSSFVRQLNTYGFRKVDTDKWEFAHEVFLRGQKHLLKNIRRRRTSHHNVHYGSKQDLDSCIEVGSFGSLDGEIDQLRRDKEVLMGELVKLRQQQQTARLHLHGMEDRLKRTEMKQQQMMNFLARAMQNPNFLQQLVQKKERKKQLEEAITKKRRRTIEGPSSIEVGALGQGGGEAVVKVEPEYYGDISELDVSGLDNFAMDMPVTDENEKVHDGEECMEKEEEYERRGKDLSEVFWKEFLNEGVDEEIEVLGVQEEDEEDVSVLIEQLGCLVSKPK
ncbi:putative transcription factor HSF-type-DNA-binding family [Rosa chinensis]|uniref:Putative transcription factor HSF-type-DNA-binding family n=1 Tax=Rosa chinensis TaxID=74649 RepID=A0A2P6QPK0_ROSCH|nr:heat stress transcription factor A-6b [Rosa chinensis]PRQ36104.1 putative transcription factor HSF-type-DNA-binding family [Rosa chinensis]